MTLINLKNLQQENGTLLMTKTMDNMAMKMKMIHVDIIYHLLQKQTKQLLLNYETSMVYLESNHHLN